MDIRATVATFVQWSVTLPSQFFVLQFSTCQEFLCGDTAIAASTTRSVFFVASHVAIVLHPHHPTPPPNACSNMKCRSELGNMFRTDPATSADDARSHPLPGDRLFCILSR